MGEEDRERVRGTQWRDAGRSLRPSVPARALLLAGCAFFSPEAGLTTGRAYASLELGQEVVKIKKEAKTFEVRDEGVSVGLDRLKLRGAAADFPIRMDNFGVPAIRVAQGPQDAYMQGASRLAQRAVNARSEAREAYHRYRGNYDLARHYQNRVLPLHQTIQEQAELQHSGMPVQATTRIMDARARILSNIQAIEARRDFWIAGTDLKAAIVGRFGGASRGRSHAGLKRGDKP
ncbi:hypothetical protein [Methylobacterium isbiliense]|uniref:Outer membrane efflux protein n=1 Tax=Methylobacterium isbiliense TaxID=315478 RepID=A0ABQ4SMN8_9HYPH|nr:hypothetical protein [Methylobacterium isbiliense]MDN3626190.1 hypothetical protein [Methylobacterium isbiliense]GJE02961.1 hypothetical protein GMJLKIPL_4911 [Methylobacterium isbiliense]